MKIDTESFIKVSKIIEQDSKDTSYKFALLRATIDVIKLYDQQIISLSDRVVIPIGLIVERWLWYYYPLIDSEIFFPQKNGEPEGITKGKNISFRKYFIKLIEKYKGFGELEHFYNDYKKKQISDEVNSALFDLVKDLQSTITKMPMRYIGKSVTEEEYSIYKIETDKSRISKTQKVSTEFLIREMGTFSIPSDYYLVLKYLGSFIGGENSLINGWADFIVRANKSVSISKELVLSKLFIKPEGFRDVAEVKKFYQIKQNLYCVWSGKKIGSNSLNVDHVLPFAHYLNNDIWNLLPALNIINGKKSDKIPTPELIEKQKDIIFSYWHELHSHFKQGFEDEIKISLVPNLNFDSSTDWEAKTLDALKSKAEFFIDVRGVEGWEK